MRRWFLLTVLICCAPGVAIAQTPPPPGDGTTDPAAIVAAYEAQIAALQAQIADLSARIATAEAYNEELHVIRDGLPPVSEWTATHAMIYNTLTAQIFANYNLVIELRQERYEAETALAATQAALAAFLASLP